MPIFTTPVPPLTDGEIIRFKQQIGNPLDNGCWPWKGAKAKSGYGEMTLMRPAKRPFTAHRLSWSIFRGPIPDGLFVCHHCDRRECVNPDHLFVGTHLDNMRDCKFKGRNKWARGSDAAHSKLTEEQVREIRHLYDTTRIPASIIARKYGVSAPSITAIGKRKNWKHLE